ncbi:DSS1/SEM1 family-domain-containing protein [Rhodotorula diobovata]|uniref:26S proteasome complex subunit SEM1 n=1 Tax=Rhodotorula diobovata TaxID=5288 RepID=A0A5C5FXE9_9BASI|nr:DSS1/SEM1 family-domain-containing protein [Rhodotorula diobovata]
MASAAPAQPTANSAAPQQPTTANPQLLPLQEDDEFEEFPAEDWDAKDTYASSLAAKAGGGAAQGGPEGVKALDSLWEDDWDDDDVGDDFSVQLRGELIKQQDQMQS